MPNRNLLLLTLFAVSILAIVTARVQWDLAGRAKGSDLVLLDAQTIRNPNVGGEYDPENDEIFVPKMTLLKIGTRDGSREFYLRAAVNPLDAKALFRDKEPVDLQVRFDQEPAPSFDR